MLARSPASPLRALTAALGACALTGAMAGPALAMPMEHGPAPADSTGPVNCACGGARVPTSGPAADLVRLHKSGIAVPLPAKGTDVAAPDQQALKSSSLGPGPGAGPSSQIDDLRAPDSVDRGIEAVKRDRVAAASRHYAQRTDRRSPDSVDRALAATQGGTSGVTAERGRFAGSVHPPSATPPANATPTSVAPTWPAHPVSLTPPQAAAPAGDGFDWGDAAIGAGGALAILLVALGGLLMYRRRGGDLQSDLHGAPTAG